MASYHRMMLAYLRTFQRHRCQGDPDAWPTPVRLAASSATSSSSWPPPVKAACSMTDAFEHPRLARRNRSTSTIPASLAGASSPAPPRSTPLPTRSTTRAAWNDVAPDRRSARGVASRSATSSISAPSTPSRWASPSVGPDGHPWSIPQMGSYGIGISRLVWRHHRGQPRRRRHHLARCRWRRSRAAILNLKPGDPACDKAAVRTPLRRRSRPICCYDDRVPSAPA